MENLLNFIRPMKIGQIITVICEIPGFYLMLMLVAFATVNRSVILGIVAVIFLIPVIIYQLQIMKNRHEAKMKEW